ncbi:MAG: OadG family protein [Thermodesulfobacteriota bacterium]
MDTWSFGLTITIVGAGGTFVTLGVLIGIMSLLKKIFPVSTGSDSRTS